jgi:hypothetical protein
MTAATYSQLRRQAPGGTIYRLRDELGNLLQLRSYTSAIWRAKGVSRLRTRVCSDGANTLARDPLVVSPGSSGMPVVAVKSPVVSRSAPEDGQIGLRVVVDRHAFYCARRLHWPGLHWPGIWRWWLNSWPAWSLAIPT